MTAKRFGAEDLAATTDTVLMDVPSGFDATVNVRFVNRNTTEVRIRLAMVDASAGSALASLSDEDYLEYDTKIIGNEVIENTGIPIPEGYSLVVRSDTNNVTAICYGFQEQRV